MKKTLIAVAAAAALTTSAFADITFGAWLRVLPVFAASNGDDTITGISNPWGYGARVARLSVDAVATDGKAGMHMGVFNDAKNGLGPDDGTYMWAKPIDQVKLTLGQLDNNTGLRGDFTYGSWNWVRPCNWLYDGEGLTFSKVDQLGALVELFPVEGLQVFAAIPLKEQYNHGDYVTAEDTYKKTQAGFAYAIDGIGKLKAQYIGKGDDATIEAAFDLTAVENLYVTAGFAYNKLDNVVADSQIIKAAVGVSYQINDAFKVSGDFEYAGYDDIDANMAFGIGVDYNLDNGISVAADARALMLGKESGDDTVMSFLVSASKGISSNATLGVGFQGSTKGCGFLSNWKDWSKDPATPMGITAKDEDTFCWAIPVCLNVWF